MDRREALEPAPDEAERRALRRSRGRLCDADLPRAGGALGHHRPPLSPAQTVLWIDRLRTFRPIFAIAISPDLPPASHITEVGSGQKPRIETLACISNPIFGLRRGAGFLAPNPATETTVPGLVSAESSAALASWIAGALVGVPRVSTATSPMKPCVQSGLTAAALTACTSPPANAGFELVRTVIVDGLATQCAAVSTFVGEITEPVQSVRGSAPRRRSPTRQARRSPADHARPGARRLRRGETPATDASSPARRSAPFPPWWLQRQHHDADRQCRSSA